MKIKTKKQINIEKIGKRFMNGKLKITVLPRKSKVIINYDKYVK